MPPPGLPLVTWPFTVCGVPRSTDADDEDDVPVGETTSGNFSPTLGHGIALGFLPPDVEDGTAVEVEVRPGQTLPGQVVKLPFVGTR